MFTFHPQRRRRMKKMDDRTKYLGGTDASAVLGLNRWVSPLMVWMEKTGKQATEREENVAMEVGKELEDLVAQMFEKRTGKKAFRKNATIYHNDYPFLGANIDRQIVGENALLECKTASVFKEREWMGEDIPQEYIIQCLHYLFVTGYEKAYLAVLIGNHKYIIKEILREEHENFISDMIQQEIDFWKNHVEPQIIPPTLTSFDGTPLFELFSKSDAETVIELDNSLNTKFERLTELQAEEKNIKNEMDIVKNEIKALLGEAKTGRTDEWQATWTLQSRTTLDTKKLKENDLETYEKYSRTSDSKVFRFKQLIQNSTPKVNENE